MANKEFGVYVDERQSIGTPTGTETIPIRDTDGTVKKVLASEFQGGVSPGDQSKIDNLPLDTNQELTDLDNNKREKTIPLLAPASGTFFVNLTRDTDYTDTASARENYTVSGSTLGASSLIWINTPVINVTGAVLMPDSIDFVPNTNMYLLFMVTQGRTIYRFKEY